MMIMIRMMMIRMKMIMIMMRMAIMIDEYHDMDGLAINFF